jgi:hypothetical protein
MASTIGNFGADPAIIKWTVIRGDSSSIIVDFLENDEVTRYNTSTWTFAASTYDPKTDIIDELITVPGNGFVEVKITPDMSANWGTGYKSKVADLNFDLQVTMGSVVWTPVSGTISVLGDVSGSL